MKILKRTVFWFICAFMALVVYRGIFVLIPKEMTNTQVEKIHATKLTLDDVMGKNLPPSYAEASKGKPDYDATVAGVDENKNGIRDDVELAIFKEYPNSAKTRAVLLQYALALQMEMVQTRVNQDVVIAAVQEESRAYLCVGEILSREDMDGYTVASDKLRSFVKSRQLNTEVRKKARTEFYDQIGSHSSLDRICDIDYSALPN